MVSIILPYYNRKKLILITLQSFSYFYKKNDYEIIIVDDGSDKNQELNDVKDLFNDLNIKIIKIFNKKGFNPCYAYNIGVRNSSGNIILLSSPEIFHTKNIFDITKNFELLNNNSYLQFSVFCLTNKLIKQKIENNTCFSDNLKLINKIEKYFYHNIELEQYGVWYTHSKIKPSCLNFLSALTKDLYYKISGFDERFIFGTGYDDTEFRDRLLKSVNNNVIWYDNCVAIHIDHPSVTGDNNTNFNMYALSKKNIYLPNDEWGKL